MRHTKGSIKQYSLSSFADNVLEVYKATIENFNNKRIFSNIVHNTVKNYLVKGMVVKMKVILNHKSNLTYTEIIDYYNKIKDFFSNDNLIVCPSTCYLPIFKKKSHLVVKILVVIKWVVIQVKYQEKP